MRAAIVGQYLGAIRRVAELKNFSEKSRREKNIRG
jgi:hypothetical protein